MTVFRLPIAGETTVNLAWCNNLGGNEMLTVRMLWRWLLLALTLSCLSIEARSADRFFAYNLTTATSFSGVYLAPAGSDKWGANQALNDKDKVLDPSERLAIKDITHGRFDVKLVDAKGRTCIAHDVDLTDETSFTIRDGDLRDCR